MRKGIKQRLNLLGDHPFSSFSSANPMPGAPVEPLSEVRGALVSKALRTDPRFSCLRCSLMPGCRLTCGGFPGRRCWSPELGPGRCVLHRGCVLAEAGLGGRGAQVRLPHLELPPPQLWAPASVQVSGHEEATVQACGTVPGPTWLQLKADVLPVVHHLLLT